MIKYKLDCKGCKNQFESWFSSSREFEKIKKMKMLSCPNCKSLNVDKSLMSPNVLGATKKFEDIKISSENKKIKKKIAEYQKFIKKNFEYVGNNFAYKARSIYYEKKNPEKGIYGQASTKDIKELKEEGIETHQMPWFEDTND